MATRKQLPQVRSVPASAEPMAMVYAWPDDVAALEESVRQKRVKHTPDTLMLRDATDDDAGVGARRLRGFVRALLRVPLSHPSGTTYSLWVEVDETAYRALATAFRAQQSTSVWGTLANRLPLLEDAFGSRVCVLESGGDARARITDVEHAALRDGPTVGPRGARPS